MDVVGQDRKLAISIFCTVDGSLERGIKISTFYTTWYKIFIPRRGRGLNLYHPVVFALKGVEITSPGQFEPLAVENVPEHVEIHHCITALIFMLFQAPYPRHLLSYQQLESFS